ncbi:structural maintenance of chromosome 1 [Strigomonas culicis]|uniref:Structural maintenance of chromosomes protein n=1 Tax=Strigomonas culicis TaxID=28005 RepID=S9TS62_9TRYP|nr:structural maintenance of chromosome 1 [Strigomonas culicis]|eukprot:EPY21217.1 structural maintenance of chromosome 1 [Strigomonas culicis]
MTSKIHRVELHDFKSYVGDVIVGPFKDFSCIVGPNGSGKSNLMDAIHFVFTDVSKLEGNATHEPRDASGKPTSARKKTLLHYINTKAKRRACSVSVFLRRSTAAADRNARIEETKFTRTCNSDGQVAVLINDKHVTEKDFREQLEQVHHISQRASNFIVFQHEVERVAQKKARQLTELVEEVSGSGDWKPQYNETKRLLEQANEQVANASLEKRGATVAVNQMKLAKKEAEKYESLHAQFVEERRDAALTELFHVETELEKQKTELSKFHENLAQLQKKITSEEEIQGMKKQYAALHKAYLEELRHNRKSAEELRSKHNTLERIKAALAYLTRKYETQKHEVDLLLRTDTAQSKETERLKAEKEKQLVLLKKFDEACEKEDRENPPLSKRLAQSDLEEYYRLRKEADCETVTLKQQCDTLERQKKSLQDAIKQCTQAEEYNTERMGQLRKQMEYIATSLRDLGEREVDLEKSAGTLQKDLIQAQTVLSQTRKKNKEREEELVKIQEQLHDLRYIKDNDKQNSRFADTLQALRSLFPIKGRLVDLCTVPNEKHRSAVTVAMGKNLEAIVVDSTSVAVSCVRYLKEQRLPPMTFLPLDAVQGKSVDDRLRALGGSCKPVADVLRYEPELQPVIQFVIGQTLLCDTVEEGRKIAYGQPGGERFKVVTLDGTMMLKNGSVQGGLASVQSRARKWDDKKYEDLRAARDRLLSEAAGGSEAELARAQIRIRDVQGRLDFTKNRQKTVEEESKALRVKQAKLQAELQQLEEAQKQLQARKATHQENQSQTFKATLELFKSIAEIEGNIFKEFVKKVHLPNIQSMERREAGLAEVRAARRQELQLLIHKLDTSMEAESRRDGSRFLSDRRESLEKVQQELAQCKKDLVTYQAIVDKTEKSFNSLKTKVVTLRSELDALEEKIRLVSRNSEVELNRLSIARQGATGLQAACDTLRMRRQALVRRCQMEETEIPFRAAPAVGSKRPRAADQRGKDDAADLLLASEPFDVVPDANLTQSSTAATPSSSKSAEKRCIDFSKLTDALRRTGADRVRFAAYKQRTDALLQKLALEMEALAPNMKAASRYLTTEDRLGTSSTHLDAARERARQAHAAFQSIKEKRTERFMQVYEKIAANVDRIYKELTMGTRAQGVHGSAYLSLEDAEEPYLGGITYNATPPMKRFMPMELLSGGERTMAALALLFAIHAVAPTPFFVLDEVDAALDAGNVEKLARYLRENSARGQYIVVSHKEQLYHMADMLLGVVRDTERDGSRVMTLDLHGYPY